MKTSNVVPFTGTIARVNAAMENAVARKRDTDRQKLRRIIDAAYSALEAETPLAYLEAFGIVRAITE